MSQPPRGDDHPTAGLPGHPEPPPDPGPPQPIPPPIPAPEPPHAAASTPVTPPGEMPPPGPVAPPGSVAAPGPSAQAEPAEQPTRRQPVIEPDRVWQAPIPPGQQFQPAHEAHWPPQPGQQQWQPTPRPGEPHPQHALPAPPHQPGQPVQPWPAPQPTPAPRNRRTVLWLSLATVLTLLLCGGGAVSAFLLLRNADSGDGAPDPATAVNRFLTAVYSEQDAGAANALVCREARDRKKISAKVDEVKGYSSTYDAPEFRWEEPAVSGQQDQRATVAVKLTMTTNDEKIAQQRLTFTVVKKTGWWVCEVAG